ncbi:MAG: aminotransferase class I/II-fold pyridoxal phosphate-dependent enzyme [Acidobacteriota bacterium]|nr:aminotransferase class I/II-fold pyridoxal phosphate-dependent enzyme [Acidobacteriota bacterium]
MTANSTLLLSSNQTMSSDYMQWAKTNLQARFNLASSGLMNYPLSEFPVKLEDLELSGSSYYGYEPLQKALAEKCGVPAECVVAATGTSMANHLAFAALLEPGDEVLIEQPTYELLLSTARYLRADVKRFIRPVESGFSIEPDEIAHNVSSRTKLIVLTNLHNPSSAFTTNETLRKIGEIARDIGARVLVDEVYLDALFDEKPPTAFHLGKEFIVTSSLTKVYGLSGLRCGWILAEPEIAQKMWLLNDLFGVIPAHSAERLSCIALANLDRIAARARSIIETNRETLNSFYKSCKHLEWTEHKFGTVSFPRLKKGNVDALCALLAEKYETSIVPGRFFEMPQHLRIGVGIDNSILKEGLNRLEMALQMF